MKVEIRVTQPPANEYLEPPEMEKARIDPPLEPSKRVALPTHCNFWPQEL